MYVLITGGTSGIGYALAEEFAARGYDMILVSSSNERLLKVQQQLQAAYEITVIIIQMDLTKKGAAKDVFQLVQHRQLSVGILINNAGFGVIGGTEQIDLQEDEDMLMLNVVNVVELCKLFLPEMYQRQAGKILNVASTGAFQPGPYTATYFSSKAFVLNYSKAIRYEAKRHNVEVCTLCPGATATHFFRREHVPVPRYAMAPSAVAAYAYRQLQRNHSVGIPGIVNRLSRYLPETIKMIAVAKLKQKKS